MTRYLIYIFSVISAVIPCAKAMDSFVLADEKTSQVYGPFTTEENEIYIDNHPSLNRAGLRDLVLRFDTNQTFIITGYARGINRTWGPFTFTNNYRINLGTIRVKIFTGAEMDAAVEKHKIAEEERIKKLEAARAAALSAGLLAFYPFNGDTADASGNGQHGVNINGVFTEDRHGAFNSAIYLNGQNAYVSIGNAINPGQFSLCAWIKPDSLDGAIISKLHNIPGQFYKNYEFRIEPNGGLSAHIPSGRGPGWESVSAPRPLGVQRWNHVALTYDGSIGRIFVNGREMASQPLNGYAQSYVEATIGARPESLEHPGKKLMLFRGAIDDFKIYDRALSLNELQLQYKTDLLE